MADVRYFRVEKDTALPRAFRAVRDNSGTTYDFETEGIAYDAGDYVSSDNIDPRVVARLDDGDDHLNSLLTEVDQKEVDEAVEDGRTLRLPEHSVEAYVLASDEGQSYAVLSTEEGLELSNSLFEAKAEEASVAREEAENQVDPVEEEDAPSAVDFAAAKGEADRKAGRAKNVTEQVAEGNLEVGESKPKAAKKAAAKKGASEQPHQRGASDAAAEVEKKDN